jgi:hypothetical protein
MSIGIAELAILGICCAIPIILLVGSGVVLTLVKLGVISSYWLKGENSSQDGGNYILDQSRDVANIEEEE